MTDNNQLRELKRNAMSRTRRVIFDNDGDAYMIVEPSGNPLGCMLMHSTDNCRTWTVYSFASLVHFTKLTFQDGHNDLSNPPSILTPSGNKLDLYSISKNPNGTLDMSNRKRVSSTIDLVSGSLNNGRGAPNMAIRLSDKTHIVFAGDYEHAGNVGTPHYAVTYNHTTDTMSSEVYLGSTGKQIDNHNFPGISVDSQGYLHVVLGAHGYSDGSMGYSSEYIKSLTPNSITGGWTTPYEFGTSPGITYLSLLCDPNDNLHMAFRNHNSGSLPMRLTYLRKKSGQSWESRNDLVIPFLKYNSNYLNCYQKLGHDRRGRLFITYWNYRANWGQTPEEIQEQQDAYDAKWPCDAGTYAHDPAILISDDGGDNWRLAVTDDFVNGIIP